MHATAPEAAPAPAQQESRTPDPEVTAIGKVQEALAGLEPDVQQRVIRWAAERFKVALPTRREPHQKEEEGGGGSQQEVSSYENFSSLYDAADPQVDSEKALVAGYWLE